MKALQTQYQWMNRHDSVTAKRRKRTMMGILLFEIEKYVHRNQRRTIYFRWIDDPVALI